MKKSNHENQEDQDLHQFFSELKGLESQLLSPDLDQLLATDTQKSNASFSFWRYAAVVLLLITGISIYRFMYPIGRASTDATEIIISYELPKQAENEEELLPPGLDQWQSETDILLTGL